MRYISPLARAQQLENVTAIERLGANVANLAQVSPDVTDLIDTDEATRVIADALGVPAKIIRTSDAVEQLRQQRQQAQQQQAGQALMMQAGSEAATTAGQQVGAALGQRVAGG